VYVGVVLVGLVWLAVRRRYGAAPWPKLPVPDRVWLVPLFAASSVALFIAKLLTVAFVAHHQIASVCYLHLPVPVVADFDQISGGAAMVGSSAALAAYAVAQAFLLACLYLAFERRPLSAWERRATGCVFALGIAAAILSPAMTSRDPYMYFSFAKLGLASYAAAPRAIDVPDFPTRAWCYDLLLPSAYGPAFVLYERTLLAAVHNPVAAVVVLRSTNALWLIACIAFLKRIGVVKPAIAIFALNPVVLFEYVTNAHNDIIAICLILAAMSLDGALLASLAMVTVAGLVKLPFAAIGALAFARRPSLPQRVVPAVAGVLLTVALSYAIAGRAYFAGLWFYHNVLGSAGNPLEIALTAFAVVAVVFAIARQAYTGIAPFSFPAFSAVEIEPWYALWGLPYALRERRHLAIFLILLPIGAYLMDDSVSAKIQLVLFVAICAVVGTLAVRDLRFGRRLSGSNV
jgi:hypothetical protein